MYKLTSFVFTLRSMFLEILGRMPASIAGSLAVAMVQVSRERGAGTRRALSLTGVNIGVYCTYLHHMTVMHHCISSCSHNNYSSKDNTVVTAWENPTSGKPLNVS